MDLGRVLRERLRQAFEAAPEKSGGQQTNVAAAVNVNSSGHVTSVYSDAHVTIIQRDGETQVIRHDEEVGGQERADQEEEEES